jgi:hypothetical protein
VDWPDLFTTEVLVQPRMVETMTSDTARNRTKNAEVITLFSSSVAYKEIAASGAPSRKGGMKWLDATAQTQHHPDGGDPRPTS